MCCSNVRLDKSEQIANCKQRRRIRRGNLPLMSFYTITIRQSSKSNKNELSEHYTNRIHLCRGHFKHYSDDKPLFGKYSGSYWWQPSVRGRNKSGEIVKDYKVATDAIQ
jgi:hypothetical protein